MILTKGFIKKVIFLNLIISFIMEILHLSNLFINDSTMKNDGPDYKCIFIC